MKLSGAIVEHQNSLLRLYRKLEERFEENSVIQTLWRDMADDISLQIQSIQSFPPSLWNRFKNVQDDDFESAIKSVPSPPADVANISLRDGFEISLQLAEPVVLKIYARVIRLLRENSTAPALNFYILVKTYVTRLARTAESFAGDPLLIRRAQSLMLELEKGIQEPAPEIKDPASKTNKALSTKAWKTSVSAKADTKIAKKTTKKTHKDINLSAPRPAKTAPVETKTLSGKTSTTTKRARR